MRDRTPEELAELDRILRDHTEPLSVVRACDRDQCPYCRAFPDLPCAVHTTGDRQ